MTALPFTAVVPVAFYQGRRPKISSSYHSADRPSHDGVDLMFARLPSDGGPPAGAVPHTSKGHFMPFGRLALALGPGKVVTSTVIGTGGYVVIDHPGGFTSQYMHLFDRFVKVGDVVKAGQPVGVIGYDARPDGYKLIHLHFQMRKGGALIDPAPYLASLPVVEQPVRWGWLVAGGVAVVAGLIAARFIR